MQRPPPHARLQARLLFLAYAGRLLLPRLGAVVLISAVGGAVFRARSPGTSRDFIDACYQVYTQLFFEHTTALPDDGVLRFLFFTIPLLGAVVVAEGLLKLGASLMDFRNHREAWVRIMAKTLKDHVVLLGLGHVGYRVLEELRSRGRDVVVVESRDEGPFVEEARAQKVPLIIGDARRESLLHDTGIERAAAVVACTDDDLVNLEVCVDARKLNPSVRLVMRMFDQGLAQKIGDAFQLDNTFSTSALAAPLFAAAALDRTVHGAYRLGDCLMVTVELRLAEGSPLVDKTVADIEAALEVPVVGLHRRGRTATHRFARTETVPAGDAVVCHVASDELEAVQAKCLQP